MAICPVCKSECQSNLPCPVCGFGDIDKVFINREDAETWKNTVLVPYRIHWHSQNVDFRFAGTKLLKYTGSDAKVIIPGFITVIGESAFSQNSSIEVIEFPENLRRIEKWAFANCKNLKRIVIPDMVEELEEHSFYGCDNLEYVHIGESVTSIDMNSFEKCPNLKSFYIGKSLQYLIGIEGGCFTDSKDLEISVNPCNHYFYVENSCFIEREKAHLLLRGNSNSTIPNYITSIGPYCFANNTKLGKTLTIPSGITEIHEAAFYGCGINHVRLPHGLKVIGNAAFGDCDIDKVVIPSSVVSMGEVPFEGSNNIEIYFEHTKSTIDARIKKTKENATAANNSGEFWDDYWDKNGEYNAELRCFQPSKSYFHGEWRYDKNNQPVPRRRLI